MQLYCNSLVDTPIFATPLQVAIMERIKENIDIAGLFTSGLCALHCMALPIFLAFGLFEGLSSALHHSVELAIYSITFVFASFAVYNGWQRHENNRPFILFILGFVIVTIGMFIESDMGHFIMAIGGLTIAIGHFINYKLLKVSACCA